MTSRLGLRLLALALPVALLAPAAAHARSLTVADSTGDAQAVNVALAFEEPVAGTGEEGPYFIDAPAETSADIVSTTIDHASKRLTLTLQLRDLVELEGHASEFRIYTPDARWDLSTSYADGDTRWTLFPARGGAFIVSDNGSITAGPSVRPCRTVRARYDAATATLRASVPTVCIGKPKWVQIAAGVFRTRITPLGDGSANIAAYADDAFRGTTSFESVGRSPKVRRG